MLHLLSYSLQEMAAWVESSKVSLPIVQQDFVWRAERLKIRKTHYLNIYTYSFKRKISDGYSYPDSPQLFRLIHIHDWIVGLSIGSKGSKAILTEEFGEFLSIG